MQKIVFDQPYEFVPPIRSRIWPWVLEVMLDSHLRKKYGIVSSDVRHAQRLRASIDAGHGVLLTPNHCRPADPMVMGLVSRHAKTSMYAMASWHVFMQNRWDRFFARRLGGFSVYREGMDRLAVNTAVDKLADADRPVIIFPEGVINRCNDSLSNLMEGVSLIARSAAKKRAKLPTPGKVVVHPVGIRYLFRGDLHTAVDSVLDAIETRLSWAPRKQLPLLDRIYTVGQALLTLKEIEYLGAPQPGDIYKRLAGLIDHLLMPLEVQWAGGLHNGTVVARVKRLRTAIVPDLVKKELTPDEKDQRWRQLSDMYLAQQLSWYPPEYIRAFPSVDRYLETVERFEEDLNDVAQPHNPMHVVIEIGEAIEVDPARERGEADPLMQAIDSQLREMLARLSQECAMFGIEAGPLARAISGS